METRAEIKQQAKAALHSRFGLALGAFLLLGLLEAALATASVGIAGLILSGPLAAAEAWVMLCLYRGEECSISAMFGRGFDNVGRKIGGYLWMLLWGFLWALVGMVTLFIPTIIKGYSYAMTPYILADLPEIPATDALKLSMRMMDGHKWELFVFQLSFIGWILLSALTFGILTLYVGPYMSIANAGFYDEVKQDAIRRGILIPTGMDDNDW